MSQLFSSRVRDTQAQLREGNDLSDEDFEYFYEYFSNTGEMPYGTAKARDGDPYEWIIDKLESL